MKSKYVAVMQFGALSIHIPHQNGSSATLCGLDGDDPGGTVDQTTVPVPKGARIDCAACYEIWLEARRYNASDFEVAP
mgnify:CR=1 FL=1